MENSPIFDEIWPKSLYYSTGTLGQILNNDKNSNFDRNRFKLSTQY